MVTGGAPAASASAESGKRSSKPANASAPTGKAGHGGTAAAAVQPTDAHAVAALLLRPGAKVVASDRGVTAAKTAATGAPVKSRRLLGQANAGGSRTDAQAAIGQQELSQQQPVQKLGSHAIADSIAAHQVHPAALEQQLAGQPGEALGLLASQRGGCDTLASSLSVSVGPEAMAGVTRQQLQQVLQRPWLQDALESPLAAATAGTTQAFQAAEPAAAQGTDVSPAAQGSAAGLSNEHSPADPLSLLAVIESNSSSNGCTYNSRAQPPAADRSSGSARPSADAGDTGSSATKPQRSRGQRQPAADCSSNGSSWPGMKASAAGAGSSPSSLPPVQSAARPSPLKTRPAGIRLRGRSRAQPQQLSTSLESAATLPLQGAPGYERASHGSSVAEAPPQQEAPTAAAWASNSLERVQEEQQQQQWVSQQIMAEDSRLGGPSSSSLAADTSATSQCTDDPHLARDDSSGFLGAAEGSAAMKQQAADQGMSHKAKQRRRWAAGPSVLEQQQQWRQPSAHQHPQHSKEDVLGHKGSDASTPPASAREHQALSKKHLQALAADAGMDSSGELSATTSDLACMSTTSAATGCTTLSGLAGVYLQHPSKPTKVCPRPSFVPKLQLQSISDVQMVGSDLTQPHQLEQAVPQLDPQQQQQQHLSKQEKQQQQQQGQQHSQAGSAAAALTCSTGSQQGHRHKQRSVTPCSSSSTGHHLGSARSYLTPEELADMAPLMAHPSSSRARRHSSAASTTPRTNPVPAAASGAAAATARSAESAGPVATAATNAAAAVAAAATRCTPRASRSSNGSIISNTSGGAAAAAAGVCEGSQQGQPGNTVKAAACPSVLQCHPVSRPGAPQAVAGEHSSSNNGVNRSSVGGGLSTRAHRPSSGGGSNAGLTAGVGSTYWGSSAGSYPASENPSRQPTPRLSDNAGAAPNAMSAGGGARPGLRSRPSTARGNGAHAAAAAGGSSNSSTQSGSGPPGNNTAAAPAADAAAVAGSAAGTAAAGQDATGATSHGGGVVLTAIRPPCAASATAAAAGSFMTMRPAHLYRSVSTGEWGGLVSSTLCIVRRLCCYVMHLQ